MSYSTTTQRPLNLHRAAWMQLADVLDASLGAAWRGWREAQRRHAEQVAVRQLDRRTRQDLGLTAFDDPRADALARHHDQLRW